MAVAAPDGEQIFTGYKLGLSHVPPEGAKLDLAQNAMPILLICVVALDDSLQLEALGRISDLLAPEHPDAPVHIFPRDRRLHLFDTDEVLLVQRAQPLKALLEFIDFKFQFLSLQGGPSKGCDLQIIEAHGRFPVVKSKMLVAFSSKGIPIHQGKHKGAI